MQVTQPIKKIRKKKQSRSELKYNHLFKNMLDGFAYCKMIFDSNKTPVDFVYLQINEAFSKLTGLKKSIIGKKVTEVIPEIKQEHPELFEIYGRVTATGKPEKFELFFKPLNMWLYLSVYSPKKGYFVAIFENVTERKKIETTLKNNNERFSALANSLPEIVFETDLTGKMTYANQKALEIGGYSQEDLAKGPINIDFFAPRDRDRARINFIHAMMTSTPTNNEYALLKKDGSEFHGIVKGVPIKINDETVGMRGLIIDITDQKRTAETLIFQSQLLQAVGQPIIEIDNDRIIRYWNNGATNLYGWNSEEVMGKTLDDVLNTGYSQSHINDMLHRLESGESWSSEDQIKDRNGNTVTGIVTRHPVLNHAGKLVGCTSVFTDITEQKCLELELKGYVEEFALAEDKIQKLNDKLRVIASLTRHDVRNKLGVINGYIYLLRKQISNNEVAMKHLTKMDEALVQLLAILEFERIYEQIGSEKLDFINVSQFFSEASSLVSDFKGVKTKCECDGLKVLADSLLRQLLYNLIDNTMKYGEKTKLIKLHYEKDGTSIHLIYEDDGVGMNDEVRVHLFEKGFGKGTGLGLYMIKRIIEAYGWSIEENGKLGLGARFTITIPLNKFNLIENTLKG